MAQQQTCYKPLPEPMMTAFPHTYKSQGLGGLFCCGYQYRLSTHEMKEELNIAGNISTKMLEQITLK